MIKGVLLDLDNTLINNPDRAFAMAFLQHAEQFFQAELGINDFYTPFRAAIDQMCAAGADPTLTNHERVTRNLQSASGQDQAAVEQVMHRFYVDVFPKLMDCISPVKDSARLIEWLQDMGYAVVIATNPLYNARALELRLERAGLIADLDVYAFVTHAENMHTAKPNPAYYAEILARVGIEPDQAVMVGDSQKNDINPAQQLGIHTYHITNAAPTDNSGSLTDFIKAIRSGWLDIFHMPALSPQMIEPQLRGNISALYGMTTKIEPRFWNQHPDPDEWSPLQIVCHLAESEKSVQRPRLQKILAEDNPFLAAPKEPPGPAAFNCATDAMTYVRNFAEERLDTITFLAKLTKEDWTRPARHSIFGPTTLLEMAHFTAQHDRLHLNQLCQTVGRCE